ncbi:MAG: hypothetical protein AAB400_02975 [Patescibacteria group bacterium]
MKLGGHPHQLIGISGKMASGKGSVSKYLVKEYNAEKHASSGPLRAIVDIFGIPQSRVNLSDLSTFLRETYGEQVIAHAMLKLLTESKAPITLFDGMRRLIDVHTFRQLPNFTFIFVDCDEQIRYQRYVVRNENAGDAEMSWDEFQKRGQAETEVQIDQLKTYADIVIDNSGTYEELIIQTRSAVEEILKK